MAFSFPTCAKLGQALTTWLLSGLTPAADKAALCAALSSLCGTGGGGAGSTNNYYVAPTEGTVAPAAAPSATQSPYYVQTTATGKVFWVYTSAGWTAYSAAPAISASGTSAPTVAPAAGASSTYSQVVGPYRHIWTWNGTAWAISGTTVPDFLALGVTHSGEAVTLGAFSTVRVVGPQRLVGVRGYVDAASSAGVVEIDILKNGVSVLTTKITIDATELTSVTAAVQAALIGGAVTFVDDDLITASITAPGTNAAGASVTLIFG